MGLAPGDALNSIIVVAALVVCCLIIAAIIAWIAVLG
jgi:hypothetical protein